MHNAALSQRQSSLSHTRSTDQTKKVVLYLDTQFSKFYEIDRLKKVVKRP